MTVPADIVQLVIAAPQSAPADPVCDDFRPAMGAAHPWCDRCGWRSDYHGITDGQARR